MAGFFKKKFNFTPDFGRCQIKKPIDLCIENYIQNMQKQIYDNRIICIGVITPANSKNAV